MFSLLLRVARCDDAASGHRSEAMNAGGDATRTGDSKMAAPPAQAQHSGGGVGAEPSATTTGSGRYPPPPGSASAAPAHTIDMTNNPGSYEDLHKKCKDVFPICFDGAKAMLQKGLSNHFQITHTVTLSPANNGYRFGATYVGTKQISQEEAFPVLLGDVDLSGNTSATVLHQIGRTRLKAQAQIAQSKFAVFQSSAEYRGRAWTGGITLANPDLVSESGIAVAQYLRRVMPRLDLGLEMVYQYGSMVPGGRVAALSYAARYNGDACVASAAVGRTGLHVCYYQNAGDGMQLGVEWETNARLRESVATFGYQIELPKANLMLRASCDTQWTVGAVVEKRLTPLPFTLALSGMLNHAKAASKFGIGLIIG